MRGKIPGNRAMGLCLAAAAFILSVAAPAAHSAPTPENGVTAHRGASVSHPENSLEAFHAANEIGADWIETDVYLTKDGQLVLAHNPTTGEYSSKNLHIGASTFAELAELDMAEKFRARRKLTPAQCPKVRIVRLEEAIDLVLREKKARLSLQPKNDCVDRTIALIREKKAQAWVGFNDGSLQKMVRVKQLEPSIPVFWDRFASDVDKDIATARAHGFESVVMFWKDVTAEKVAKLKAAGFKAGAWTVNDPAEMKRQLDMGVTRIYTDAPDVLFEVMRRRVKDAR